MTTKLATSTTHTAKLTDNAESGTTVLTAAIHHDGSLALEMTAGSRLLDLRLDAQTARDWAAWITKHVPAPSQKVSSGDQI